MAEAAAKIDEKEDLDTEQQQDDTSSLHDILDSAYDAAEATATDEDNDEAGQGEIEMEVARCAEREHDERVTNGDTDNEGDGSNQIAEPVQPVDENEVKENHGIVGIDDGQSAEIVKPVGDQVKAGIQRCNIRGDVGKDLTPADQSIV